MRIPHREDEYDDLAEEQLFAAEREHFYNLTEETTEVVFNESINNADVPSSMSAGILTRDKLKQPWEEACARADNLGDDAVSELESALKKFAAFCNDKSCEDMVIDDDHDGAIIPATGAKYTGSAHRIKNTHHMPASSNFKG